MRRWDRVRPFFKYLFVLCLLALVYAYAMFQGGFVSWFLFYSVTTVVIFTIVVSFFPFKVRKIERIISKKAIHAGENVEVNIVLHKHRLQPFFFLRIEDRMPKQITGGSASTLFFFSFQQRFEHSYVIRNVERGVYSFEKITLVLSDLFGFIERRTSVKCKTELYVLPRVHRLTSTSSAQALKILEGSRMQKLDQSGHSISGVREYIPGDRLTRIDWKQSARSMDLMTKEFEASEGGKVILVFDCYQFEENEHRFEQAVELVASLLVQLVEKTPEVKLVVRSEALSVTPITTHSLQEGLKSLARISVCEKPISPSEINFEQWRNAQVYFVTTKVTSHLKDVCLAMIEQNITLTLFDLEIREETKKSSYDDEIEKMGIQICHIALE